jgi:hypothetical protein
MVHRSAPCRRLWNSCLRQGRLRAMTFRTTAYLAGKPIQGPQPAVESRNEPKGGKLGFCKFSVYGETIAVEPKFSRDDNHIRHSLLMVTTPKYHVSFDDMGTLFFGGRRAMSLIGNQRAPKHSQRSTSVKAGSPTGREPYGDGILIVPGQAQSRARIREGAALEGGSECVRDTDTQDR